MHQCYIKKSISLRLFAFFKCLETLSTRGWPTSRCRGELGALLPTPRGVHWKQVGRIFCTGSEFIPAISGWQTDLQIDRLIQRQLAARSWLVHLSSPVSPMSIEAPPAPFTCHVATIAGGARDPLNLACQDLRTASMINRPHLLFTISPFPR